MGDNVAEFKWPLSIETSVEKEPFFMTADYGGISQNITYNMVNYRKKVKIVVKYCSIEEMNEIEKFLEDNLRNKIIFTSFEEAKFVDAHKYIIISEPQSRTYEGSSVSSISFTVAQVSRASISEIDTMIINNNYGLSNNYLMSYAASNSNFPTQVIRGWSIPGKNKTNIAAITEERKIRLIPLNKTFLGENERFFIAKLGDSFNLKIYNPFYSLTMENNLKASIMFNDSGSLTPQDFVFVKSNEEYSEYELKNLRLSSDRARLALYAKPQLSLVENESFLEFSKIELKKV